MAGCLLVWLLAALTMPAPPSYTTSLVLELRDALENTLDDVDRQLRRLPGVKDVVIVENASTAYLKVDRQHFREDQLADFDFVRQGKST